MGHQDCRGKLDWTKAMGWSDLTGQWSGCKYEAPFVKTDERTKEQVVEDLDKLRNRFSRMEG